MSGRLVVRITLRDQAAQPPAAVGRAAHQRRPVWIAGIAVAVAVATGGYLLMEGGESPPARQAVANTGAEQANSPALSIPAPSVPAPSMATPAPDARQADGAVAAVTADKADLAARKPVRPAGAERVRSNPFSSDVREDVAEAESPSPVQRAALIGAPVATSGAMPKQAKAGPDRLEQLAPDAERAPSSSPSPPSAPPAPSLQEAAEPGFKPARLGPAPTEISAINDPHVQRAQLTAGIRRREPTGGLALPVEVDPGEIRTIYYFSEIRDLVGHTLMHRWERDGQVMAMIPFTVGGKRWRAHSSKRVSTHLGGNWRVTLVDADGRELASSSFTVQ